MTATAPSPAESNPFGSWLDQYQYNVLDFGREVLGFEPDVSLDPAKSDGQIDAMLAYESRIRALRDAVPADGSAPDEAVLETLVRQISAVSGHGVGKTTALAICITHHICCFFPQRVMCTSATEKQLFNALAAEVKAWMKKLPPAILDLFEIKTERIELKAAPEESYIAFQTSSKENTEALAGVHSRHVLLVVDEASGVPDAVFEAASGSMSDYRAITILTGNPVRTSGHFYDSHQRKETAHRWARLHLDCRYSPRVSPTWVKEMAEKYGEDSNAFRVRVLGQFPKQDDEAFIGRELATSAVGRDVAVVLNPIRTWGLDCARFGKDKSALVKRHGNVVLDDIKVWGGLDTMQVVGRVKWEWDATPEKDRPVEILVDVIGIGSGVVDRLRELGLPVRGINVGESAAMTDRYANLKSELWGRAKEWLQKRDCVLPDDRDLIDELCAPGYDFNSSGKLIIEPKKSLKKRGLPSPDIADAFVLTFASDASTALHGRSGPRKPIRRNLRGIV